MTHLRQRMLDELQRRNYSQSTACCCIHTVEDFAQGSKHRPHAGAAQRTTKQNQSRLMDDLAPRIELHGHVSGTSTNLTIPNALTEADYYSPEVGQRLQIQSWDEKTVYPETECQTSSGACGQLGSS